MELIPSLDAIPVETEWFRLFMTPAFMIHLLLMNIMVGGSIIAFVNSLRMKSVEAETVLEHDIAEKLTFVISLAINFGVATLLFVQVLYGQFIYVTSQLMAVLWLSVIALLMIAYYGAYYYKLKFNDSRQYVIGAVVLIFLCIAFFFCNNITLMLNPSSWTAYFDNPKGTILNVSDPSLLPRFLHFMIASLAIGGLFVAIVWTLKKDHPAAQENIERGMNWFVYATLVQVGIGFWFQMSLPKEIIGLFMGADSVHTILFLTSLCLVVAVFFLGIHRKVWASAGFTLLLVFLMILMRDMVRTAYLKPYFTLADIQVQAQYSPMIFFLASLIAGTAAVVYVIRLAMKTSEA